MGKGDGRGLAIAVRFLPDGLLVATIRRATAEQELTTEARGTYELRGDTARIVLMEQGVAEPVAYTGTISKSGAEGRMTQSGRNLGKFSVQP
jgi:NAD(P)-dependent dehydrogenase (short-subunit alcohol dehydrogenase family)